MGIVGSIVGVNGAKTRTHVISLGTGSVDGPSILVELKDKRKSPQTEQR